MERCQEYRTVRKTTEKCNKYFDVCRNRIAATKRSPPFLSSLAAHCAIFYLWLRQMKADQGQRTKNTEHSKNTEQCQENEIQTRLRLMLISMIYRMMKVQQNSVNCNMEKKDTCSKTQRQMLIHRPGLLVKMASEINSTELSDQSQTA